MITKLLAAALAIIGLLPALASAQRPFDYEKTNAQYSVRDYAFSQLPQRGYGHYKIAENAWFVHDDFENMVFLSPMSVLSSSIPSPTSRPSCSR